MLLLRCVFHPLTNLDARTLTLIDLSWSTQTSGEWWVRGSQAEHTAVMLNLSGYFLYSSTSVVHFPFFTVIDFYCTCVFYILQLLNEPFVMFLDKRAALQSSEWSWFTLGQNLLRLTFSGERVWAQRAAFYNHTLNCGLVLTKQHTWKVVLRQQCEPSMWRHGAAAAGAAAVRQVGGSGVEPMAGGDCGAWRRGRRPNMVVHADCLPLSSWFLQVSTTRPPPSFWTAAEWSWSCGECTLSCVLPSLLTSLQFFHTLIKTHNQSH